MRGAAVSLELGTGPALAAGTALLMLEPAAAGGLYAGRANNLGFLATASSDGMSTPSPAGVTFSFPAASGSSVLLVACVCCLPTAVSDSVAEAEGV